MSSPLTASLTAADPIAATKAVATAASFAPVTGPYGVPSMVTVYSSSASVPFIRMAITGVLSITLSDSPAGKPVTVAVFAPPYK